MKIALILAGDNIYRYRGPLVRFVLYAPLTLTTLAALVPDDLKAEIDLVDEGVQRPPNGSKKYDVVGISCVASSANRAYRLASYWRRRGAFVVLGGHHPTLMTEEAARHADAVVVGPAEESWPRLLREWNQGRVKKIYRSTFPPILSRPPARRELQARFAYYLSAPAVSANRGCRHHCEFCSIPILYGGKGIVRPVGEVIEEIKRLKARRIIIVDSCLSSDKEYSKTLFEALIPLKIRWAGADTIDTVCDREFFSLMVRSGCEGLLIGFESFSQDSLISVRKGFNRVERYREAVSILHANHIGVLGCFVLGFDHDTPADLRRATALVDELEVDIPRYAVLTPFPGTDLFYKLKQENRILTEDWSLYDTEHVVFRPNKMSPAELQHILSETWRSSYTLPRILKRAKAARKDKIMILLSSLGFYLFSRSLGNSVQLDSLDKG